MVVPFVSACRVLVRPACVSSLKLERLESGQSLNMLLREQHVQGQVFKIVFVYSVDGFISAK